MTVPEIRTHRLVLRSLQEDDAYRLTSCLDNINISRWLSVVPHPYTQDNAIWFINHVKTHDMQVWAIILDDTLVGLISCDSDFGYWLAEDHWGQGIMTEAGDAVIDYVFSVKGAECLTSSYFKGNDASRNVLLKLGFVEAGDKKCHSIARDAHVDGVALRYSRARYFDRRRISISTDRLLMRECQIHDWESYSRVGGNINVARNMESVRSPWLEADVKTWLSGSCYRGRPGYRVSVFLKDGRFAGTLGLSSAKAQGVPSVMYFFDQDLWGHGYATEAVRAFIRDAFDRFDLDALHGDHFEDNPASGAVLRKMGFEYTGKRDCSSVARLEPAALLDYRLTKANFEATHEVS